MDSIKLHGIRSLVVLGSPKISSAQWFWNDQDQNIVGNLEAISKQRHKRLTGEHGELYYTTCDQEALTSRRAKPIDFPVILDYHHYNDKDQNIVGNLSLQEQS